MSVDRSQSALIEQRRNRILNSFSRNNPTAPIIDRTAQTRQNINAGGITIYTQSPLGSINSITPNGIISSTAGVQTPPAPPATPIQLCSAGSLNTTAEYLRNYMTEFRNADFWGYTCDGGEQRFIYSGGGNMMNTGHFTTPWLLSGALYTFDVGSFDYSIQYSTVTETTTDTDFQYISLGWIEESDTGGQQIDQSLLPTTVLGFRCSGPVGWQIGGNIGYGNETAISGYIYNNATVNGFTVYAGYRQVYNSTGESRVSKCHLFILLGHPTWGSVFGPVSLYSDDTDSVGCGCYMYTGTGSENILALCTLLSKTPETASTSISDSELQVITGRFIQRIKEALHL